MALKFVKVAKLAEIPEGNAKVFTAGEQKVALCKIGDKVYAVDGVCSHADELLDGGEVCAKEHSVACPWHGAAFDVRTGAVLSMPASCSIATFETRIDAGEVFVKVDSDE